MIILSVIKGLEISLFNYVFIDVFYINGYEFFSVILQIFEIKLWDFTVIEAFVVN